MCCIKNTDKSENKKSSLFSNSKFFLWKSFRNEACVWQMNIVEISLSLRDLRFVIPAHYLISVNYHQPRWGSRYFFPNTKWNCASTLESSIRFDISFDVRIGYTTHHHKFTLWIIQSISVNFEYKIYFMKSRLSAKFLIYFIRRIFALYITR